MKSRLFTLVVIAILLTSNAIQAKSKVLLRLNLQKGATYEMTMALNNLMDQEMMGQKMKMDQKMTMIISYQVLDVLPNSNFLIEYSLLKMKMDMNVNGQLISMDSEGTDESNPVAGLLKNMAKVKIKMEMTPRGAVEKVEGLDQYASALGNNPQMAQAMQMFMNEKNFGSFVGQTFNYFPENKVEKGGKWTASFKLPALMNMETIMNFEVASIGKDQVILNVSSDINMDTPIEQGGMKINLKMTGTQTGTMTVDSGDGWLRQSDLNQKIDMTMKMKNPQTNEDMEIPMVMNAITKITVIKK